MVSSVRFAEVYLIATTVLIESLDSVPFRFENCNRNDDLSPTDNYYLVVFEENAFDKFRIPSVGFQLVDDFRFMTDQVLHEGVKTIVIRTCMSEKPNEQCYRFEFGTESETSILSKSLRAVSFIQHSVTMSTKYDKKSNVLALLKKLKEKGVWQIDDRLAEPYQNGRIESDALEEKSARHPYEPITFITASDIKSRVTSDYMIILFLQVMREKQPKLVLETLPQRRRPGFRCKFCNAVDGLFFFSSPKSFHGTPALLHKHLMSCNGCPQVLKDILVRSKRFHKQQTFHIRSQKSFLTNVYTRIVDETFHGGSISDQDYVQDHIQRLNEYYTTVCDNISHRYISVESRTSLMMNSPESPRQIFGTPYTPNTNEWFAITPHFQTINSDHEQWDPNCILELRRMITCDQDFEDMIYILSCD